jgi:hypothetical protein
VPRKAAAPPKKLPNEVALERFLESATTDVGARDHIELASHLYIAFKRWCSQKHVEPMGPSAFGRAIAAEFYPVRLGQARARAWRGIRLRPRWKKIAEEGTEWRKAMNAPRSVPIVLGLKRLQAKALVRRFLTLRGTHDRVSVEPFIRLFEEHLKWCHYTLYYPLRRSSFARALKEIGLEPVRLGHEQRRAWRGYRLNP